MDTKRLGLIPSILLISLFLLSCGNSTEKKLIGEWYAKDAGMAATFILNKDDTFQMILTHMSGDVQKIPPSKEELEQGNLVLESSSWKVDESETKLLLLVSLTDTESGKTQTLDFEFNFKFLDKNRMRVTLDNDQMTLTRQ